MSLFLLFYKLLLNGEVEIGVRGKVNLMSLDLARLIRIQFDSYMRRVIRNATNNYLDAKKAEIAYNLTRRHRHGNDRSQYRVDGSFLRNRRAID